MRTRRVAHARPWETARDGPDRRRQLRVTEPHDVVIVGACHNGLTAAFYLARAGLRTLVVERREVVGGACVTEEIAPGVRASTTSYIASMLRPEIVEDLGLARHGLRTVPCEPGLQVVFEDGRVLPWWSTHERTAEEIRRISAHDAQAFGRVTERLHELARYLQPFFLEEPPNLYARGWGRVREGRRLFRRFRHLNGDQLSDLIRFATGSLGDFVDRSFESDEVRRLYLANNVYGMHAPPYPFTDVAGPAKALSFTHKSREDLGCSRAILSRGVVAGFVAQGSALHSCHSSRVTDLGPSGRNQRAWSRPEARNYTSYGRIGRAFAPGGVSLPAIYRLPA